MGTETQSYDTQKLEFLIRELGAQTFGGAVLEARRLHRLADAGETLARAVARENPEVKPDKLGGTN